MGDSMGKIISVTNQKGGVGKTTSCVNLASYVANSGNRVLFIDIDPQGNGCSTFGVEVEKGQNSIYEVLNGNTNILREDTLYFATKKLKTRLDVKIGDHYFCY